MALTPGPSPNPLRGRGERVADASSRLKLSGRNDLISPLPRSGLGEGPGVRENRYTVIVRNIKGVFADETCIFDDRSGFLFADKRRAR